MSLLLDEVTLTYPDGDGRLTALDGVGLKVAAGELVAVVGPSGSGKSSLLAVAATLVTPDRGRVVVDGVDTGALDRAGKAALRRERLGIVFQQPNLLPSLTVVEQVQIMAHLAGRGRGGRPSATRPAGTGRVRGAGRVRGGGDAARRRALELLDAVGLAAEAGRRPHQLSGGQRQRVNIARALANEPAVLLVDEPTSALDRERGEAVVSLLATLARERGAATLLVTHDPAHLAHATRTVTVRDGRLAPA